MPPRKPLTSYQIPIKIHKITVLLTLAPTDTILTLKQQALSAIRQFQLSDPDFELDEPEMERIPPLASIDQFELCKRVRNGRKFTGEYTALGDEESVKAAVTNWEAILIRMKDEDGELRPPRVAFPPLLPDEDEDMAPSSPTGEESSLKRKEPPE